MRLLISSQKVATTKIQEQAESEATDTAFPRLIKTFMKRRTHLNKNAEQAPTDPIYAKVHCYYYG